MVGFRPTGIQVTQYYCANILEYTCFKVVQSVFPIVDKILPATWKWTTCRMAYTKHMNEVDRKYSVYNNMYVTMCAIK